MTVSSLWKALEGCGTPVHRDFDNGNGIKPKSLAIDLSIWICEALSSSALSTFHADPVVHLVYQRTVKLLKLGLRLIFVIEGKRRLRSRETGVQLKTRRSGTVFWRACQSCEKILSLLGVCCVHASAEGEALCALLNQRGIVDGIISNDGDCFLFGANVVYTMFSIENLDRSQMLMYEQKSLRALLKDDEETNVESSEFNDELILRKSPDSRRSLQISPMREMIVLSREDLIAFALLTGSDLVGDGVPHVGHKKALKFIDICHRSYPHSVSTAALDELLSWGNAAAIGTKELDGHGKDNGRYCSLCFHPGDKRSHEKNGCKDCGTTPGEPCFAITTDGKFRRALRLKALSMSPPFASWDTIQLYFKPNGNEVPVNLQEISHNNLFLQIARPQYQAALQSSLVVKGHTIEGSREYLKQTMPKLLARLEIIFHCSPKNKYKRPVDAIVKVSLTKVIRCLTHNSHPCYEVCWSIAGSMLCTFEWQDPVNAKYPFLVDLFKKEGSKSMQTAMSNRRRGMFLGSHPNYHGTATSYNKNVSRPRRRTHQNVKPKRANSQNGKRQRFFDKEYNLKGHHTNVANLPQKNGDDVRNLMQYVANGEEKDFETSPSSQTSGHISDLDRSWDQNEENNALSNFVKSKKDNITCGYFPPLSPRREVIKCDMGFQIEVTPLMKRSK